jgi:dTDP-4-dehydrorhamnose reductase
LITKVLVLGATGQVGRSIKDIVNSSLDLTKIYSPLKKDEFVFASRNPEGDDIFLDLNGTEEEIFQILDYIEPSIIINAAAWTAVDLAESKKSDAYQANAYGPRALAKWSAGYSGELIHFSTDYVFDGTLTSSRDEQASTNPLQIYGESKLLGERYIQEILPRGIILRTSWVFSEHGTNFLKTMLRLGRDREELSIVSDQIGAPTAAPTLAEIALRFASKILDSKTNKNKETYGGIYHVASRGETSWYEFARSIFETGKELNFPLSVKSVKPILSSEYPTPAKRPLNSRLNVSKVEERLGITLPPWQESMLEVMKRLRTRA